MSAVDDLAKALQGAIGNNDPAQEVSGWLDTGYPPFNKILGGDGFTTGMPFGRIIEMFGPPSAGKTAIATLLMIEAQRQGGVAMFMDHENTFDVGMAVAMGLKTDFPFWIYKRPDTWEQSNTMAMKAAEAIRLSKAIPAEAPILVVFDSVAAMIPRSVFEKGIDEYTMNDTTALARVSSSTLKAVNQFTSKKNATMLYLNQIRTKLGVVFGDPTSTPGGAAFEFFASTRLSLGRTKVMEDEGGKKQMVGQVITVKTVKNKVTRPFQEVKLTMMFNEAGGIEFDIVATMVDFLIDKKVLPYTTKVDWDGKLYFKKAFIKFIKTTPGEKEKLFALYKE